MPADAVDGELQIGIALFLSLIHISAEGVTELKTKAAQNVVDVLEGRTPRYPVNHL